MPRLFAKRQTIPRIRHQFRLDPMNDARLRAMLTRYENMLGCPVSLSVLIPRALVALGNELDSFPASLEISSPQTEALREHELHILTGLCPD